MKQKLLKKTPAGGGGLRRLILLVVLSTAVDAGVGAQQLTRELTEVLHDSSFMVEVHDGRWIVASNYKEDCRFFQLDSTCSIAKELVFLPGLRVHDLKIGASIYFCGSRKDGGVRKGIMGYFNMSAFSGGNVRYFIMDEVERLDKLVSYYVHGCLHVSMVGSYPNGRSCVVDAVTWAENPGGWNVFFGTPTYYPFHLDDIAVTNNNVVLSGRNVQARMGFLFLFDKECRCEDPFFWMESGVVCQLPERAHGPVRLASGQQEHYFAAYLSDYSYNLCKYDADQYLSTNKIGYPDGPTSCALKGICTDKDSTGVNLLGVYGQNSTQCNSGVWYVPSAVVGSTGLVKSYHYYNNNRLTSIVRRFHQARGVVVSGGRGRLQVNRMKFNYQGNCAPQFEYWVDRLDHYYPKKLPEVEIPCTYRNMDVMVKVCNTETIAVNTICQ